MMTWEQFLQCKPKRQRSTLKRPKPKPEPAPFYKEPKETTRTYQPDFTDYQCLVPVPLGEIKGRYEE